MRCTDSRVNTIRPQCYILNIYSIAKEVDMPKGSVFENNRTQAVRLPAETRFPEGVKQVDVRVVGKDRILSPVTNTWDSFFLTEEEVTDDFLESRASQNQSERENL